MSSNFIITNLIGGLGNQMFQYSCGYALSQESGLNLKISTDMYSINHCHNGFELSNVFDVDIDIATNSDLKEILGPILYSTYVRKLLSKIEIPHLKKYAFIDNSNNIYEDYVNKIPVSGCYLQGWWQSEYYFLKYAEEIRELFSFKDELYRLNDKLRQEITNSNSISLHIRRGDYVSNKKASSILGSCPLSYYLSAIRKMKMLFSDARFFVFTDDPEWVLKNILTRYTDMTLITHNINAMSYSDMHLMSLCSHHIISNSTFSWWGAWLNPSNLKKVIAPKQWYLNGFESHSIVPLDWIKI